MKMFAKLNCFVMLVVPLFAGVVKQTVDYCSLTEFSCGDGGCVSEDVVCDGSRDCADGGDEINCGQSSYALNSSVPPLHRFRRQATGCRKDQWACRDGSCISFDGKCDGVVNCEDRSDESHALCRNSQCQTNWFRCTYGACVDGTAPCNGVQECADNSDELLPRCRNETDEVRGQFKCLDGSTIQAANHCDGVKDCADGSDETVRTCAAKTCPSYLFQCAYGACVDRGSDCNNIQECADNSDEADELCNRNLAPTTSVKPPKAGNCILPPYPAHGKYVTNIPNAKPGDAVDIVTINVTCRQGYGVAGSSSIYCYNGWWPEQIPKCVSQCRLIPHISVEYHCLVTGHVEGSRKCNEYEPTGTVVSPKCNYPNYYTATAFPNMRCINGNWDYVARCSPGLTKNGTNITIIIKDTIEVHVSDIQYVVPIFNNSHNLPVVPVTVEKEFSSNIPSQYDEATKKNTGAYYTITTDNIILSNTNKPYANGNNNNLNGPSINEDADAKIDESDYEIDGIDWRMGNPSTNMNKNITINTESGKDVIKNITDVNRKTSTVNANGTNIHFNISNSNVYIYANDGLIFRN